MAEVGLGEALSYGTDYKPSGNMPITKGLMMREQNALKKATLEAKAAAAETSGINKIAKYINGIEANKKFDKGDLREKLHEYAVDATYKVYNSSNAIEAQNHVNDFVKKVGELESIQANRNEHTAFLNANPSLMLNQEHALAAKNGGETYFKYMQEHPEENSPYMYEQQTGYMIPSPNVSAFKSPTNHEKEMSEHAKYELQNKGFTITSNPSGNGFVVFSPTKKLNANDIIEMADSQFGKSINDGKYKTSDLYNYYIYNGGDELKNRLKGKTGEERVNEAFNYAKEQYVKDINKVSSQNFNPKILTDPTLRNQNRVDTRNPNESTNWEVTSAQKDNINNISTYLNSFSQFGQADSLKKILGSSDSDDLILYNTKNQNTTSEGFSGGISAFVYNPKTNKWATIVTNKVGGGYALSSVREMSRADKDAAAVLLMGKKFGNYKFDSKEFRNYIKSTSGVDLPSDIQKQSTPPPQGTGGGGSKPTKTHKINLGAGN